MALKTWAEIANLGLTAGQQNKAAQFEAIGQNVNNNPDISGVTLAQAKGVLSFCRDLNRIALARAGAEYVRKKLMEDAAKAVDDGSNPAF